MPLGEGNARFGSNYATVRDFALSSLEPTLYLIVEEGALTYIRSTIPLCGNFEWLFSIKASKATPRTNHADVGQRGDLLEASVIYSSVEPLD